MGNDIRKEEKKEAAFVCEGKCRICPFPGANCMHKEFTHPQGAPESDIHRIWMSPDIQDELMKKLHVK